MLTCSDFWPDATLAAVSLSFDDGLLSQLDNAIPRLDQHQLRGTFYVNPGRSAQWQEQIPRWQAAAATGHELGNHTSRHPCSCNFAFSQEYCLEKISLEDMAATIDAAEADLDALFPEQRGQRSFCYPCYQSYVGAGRDRRSYVPLVAERFRVARGGGERPNHPQLIDLSYTWAWAVEGHSGAAMIDAVEEAAAKGHWCIICFHGIGDQHIAVETAAFNQLVDHLAAHKERLWTDTVIAVGDYILAQRAASA